MMRLLAAGASAWVLACGGPSSGGSNHAAAVSPPQGEVAPSVISLSDSLVASTPRGVELWFTLARSDSGPSGRCVARALEIREGSARRPVPLLYTTGAPEIVDDTTARAWLDDHCRRGDRYRIDLRNGRPVPDRP